MIHKISNINIKERKDHRIDYRIYQNSNANHQVAKSRASWLKLEIYIIDAQTVWR